MSDSIEVTKNVSVVANLIVKMAGAVVALSALAYYVGYKIETAYFSTAGASWVIGLMTPTELTQAGQSVIILVGSSLFSSLILLMSKSITAKNFRRLDIVLQITAVIFLLAVVISSKYWGNQRISYTLSFAAGILFALGAGFTIGELVARLGEKGLTWSGYHLKLIFFVYMSALIVTPQILGNSKANLDFSSEATSLPIAKISGELPGDWRLVRIVGGKYLLVSLSTDPALRRFKLVEITTNISVDSGFK